MFSWRSSRLLGALLLPVVLPACADDSSGDAFQGASGSAQSASGSAQGGHGAGQPSMPEQPLMTSGAGGNAAVPDQPAICPQTLLACNSLLPLPPTLKETGFFPAAPDFSSVAPALTRFQPSLELWSDGLAKQRFMLLPAGGRIDIHERERWVFPVGTIFVKSFSADGPQGPGTRPIETRIIRRTADADPLNEYEFAVYLWNDQGTDAALLEPFWPAVDVQIAVGGEPQSHEIPSRSDCDRCHGANDTRVIGFDELRLSSKLPGAAMTQLEQLAAQGAFGSALPNDPEQLSVPSDPLLEKVEGFVHGNCAHCHNGLDSSVFDLRYRSFVQNTVGQMTMGSGTSGGLRVDPGKPDSSILYRQVTRLMLPLGLNPMPPVGVARASGQGLDLLRQWISALPANQEGGT